MALTDVADDADDVQRCATYNLSRVHEYWLSRGPHTQTRLTGYIAGWLRASSEFRYQTEYRARNDTMPSHVVERIQGLSSAIPCGCCLGTILRAGDRVGRNPPGTFQRRSLTQSSGIDGHQPFNLVCPRVVGLVYLEGTRSACGLIGIVGD